jgi:maleate cis-trans isomerase
LSYQLGATALKKFPDADGLYIGGGSWLGLPSAVRLEEEFGKPVFSNSPAYVRHRLELLGLWQPIPGYVKLLALD